MTEYWWSDAVGVGTAAATADDNDEQQWWKVVATYKIISTMSTRLDRDFTVELNQQQQQL